MSPPAAPKLEKDRMTANGKVLYASHQKVLALVVLSGIALWQFILLFKLHFEVFTMLAHLNLTTTVLKMIKQLNGEEMLDEICFHKGISFPQT